MVSRASWPFEAFQPTLIRGICTTLRFLLGGLLVFDDLQAALLESFVESGVFDCHLLAFGIFVVPRHYVDARLFYVKPMKLIDVEWSTYKLGPDFHFTLQTNVHGPSIGCMAVIIAVRVEWAGKSIHCSEKASLHSNRNSERLPVGFRTMNLAPSGKVVWSMMYGVGLGALEASTGVVKTKAKQKAIK